jgi:GTP-binding protein Era
MTGTRAGFAAVIGAPNAGKSTLVNRLVGSKVTIVTQKAQTTRFPVRGVAMEGEAQIVLVDTPGIFRPRRRLDRAMVRAAWAGAQDADAVVHLVDAEAQLAAAGPAPKVADKRAAEDVRTVIDGLKSAGRQAILALNKIDRVRREDLLALTQRLHESGAYTEVLMISALDGSGVADLKRRLAELMPEGPWLYPEDQSADLPTQLLAAEITREKLYLRVHEELPYAANVETTAFEERKDGSARIEQTIYVERDGQRAIVIGAGGQTLKWIGAAARKDLTEILGRPVHLFLTVKVRANWAEERTVYRDLGLDFDV